MKVRMYRSTVAGIAIAMLLPISAAHAQLGNLLKGGGSSDGSSSGGLSSLGSMGSALTGQSMTSGSTSNVAGVLQFCIKNNYLSGNGASSVKDSLMSKLGGTSAASSDSGYTDGANGLLKSGNGQQLDLSGGGLKQQVTKQVCDKILSQGKSLLGG
ncbi:DUF2501 domain-containing protein [Caballeronia mineralivorans]|jgi:hypothetical protein|uniref:DUF2501 domain-containing protein n=1 Tax=Caballeronia mineralivorans TaxID=2010198 RepID=UPI000EFAAC47|nr:DUF2501 domain-containing protein [Caballeronia mineralivorans]MDB5789660.1 hypothetical protein [Caballeronia mineralivorans]MEA3099074.1 hypothetical protein [Caballeronia mineralivorans]